MRRLVLVIMMMMMMKSGELTSQIQDKLGDSFSFACYDPSSDDEDDVSDAESYIEIQVRQPKHRNSLHRGPSSAREVFVFERGRRCWDDAEDDDDEEEEDDHIELRISISSAVPLPRISPQCFHDAIKAIESRIGYLEEEKPIEELSSMVITKGAKWGKVWFSAVQCYQMVPSKVFRQGSIGKSRKDRDLCRKVGAVSCPSSISSSPINKTQLWGVTRQISLSNQQLLTASSFNTFPGFSFPPYA